MPSRLLRIDWLLLLSTAGIVALGLAYLHSAAPEMYAKQLLWLGCGVGAMLLAAMTDYRTWLRWAYPAYYAVLALLVLVLFCPARNGARCWIPIPGTGIVLQPVELLKIALVLALARHLMHRDNQATIRGLVMPFVITLVPAALVLRQPDLGTAILLPPLLFAVVFASGARFAHLAAVALAGLASAWPMWAWGMKEYQQKRILAFLDPERYEAREAYQLTMSLIAIGSGGLWGEGLGNGVLNELDLLPEKHNDFIFGVISEEGGLAAGAALLGLQFLLVLEALHVAWMTREPGGRLVATGCAVLLGTQTLVNVGVVTAMLPTTGITLPLVSYGGSSIVATLFLVGLVLSVAAHRPFEIARESFGGR